MTINASQETRHASTTSPTIISLVAAANENDRFKLLEDSSIRPSNLRSRIHPIFRSFDKYGPMQQMLQLASQFLAHDSLLSFFVPLLYGQEVRNITSGCAGSYLTDPLSNVSKSRRKELIRGVRRALKSLADCIGFDFVLAEKHVYARTVLSIQRAQCTTSWCSAFQRHYTARIEVAERFVNYYNDPEGYRAASLSARLRHDFLLATTLVHEIVHALGVVRRGDLNEPSVHADYPETEWGYAWENYMFGGIINPQDRMQPGTHLFMRKVWTNPQIAQEAGGKEYSDVSMQYIAQWFRKETWDRIAEHGPLAVPQPIAHFKVQSSKRYGAWIVSGADPAIKHSLRQLRQTMQAQSPSSKYASKVSRSKILWRLQTNEDLQVPNIPSPPRFPPRAQHCAACGQPIFRRTHACVAVKAENHSFRFEHTSFDDGSSTSDSIASTLKRQADQQDQVGERPHKLLKW